MFVSEKKGDCGANPSQRSFPTFRRFGRPSAFVRLGGFKTGGGLFRMRRYSGAIHPRCPRPMRCPAGSDRVSKCHFYPAHG